jgi:site-specific recombinase XerD
LIDVDGFREYLYEEELSENTIESYIYGIKVYSEKYDEITKPNLIGFKAALNESFKPKTVNLRLSAIRKYCEYKEIGIKIKEIKEPKKTHIDNIISPEQFQKLCDGLREDGDERRLVWVLLLGKTGMRISEALKIRKKDILNGSVVMHSKAHMREIYFPKSLVENIAPYLEALDDDDFVMQNQKGQPTKSRTVAGFLRKCADKYGIPKEVLHPHSFRHYFAMEFIKRKNDIALLADLLGHGSVNVTQLYLRQSQEQQKKVVDDVVDW